VESALKVKAFFVVRLRGKTFTKKAAKRRSGTVRSVSCAADPSVRSRAPLSHSLSPSRVSSLLSLWSPVRCGGLKRLNH
jgi:hypothetical protein